MTILKHHRENLEKLRDYLRSLPEDYRHFDMLHYHYNHFRGDSNLDDYLDYRNKNPDTKLNTCGTTACAVGHGPDAGIPLQAQGIPFKDEEDWEDYAFNNFINTDFAFDYLFSDKWAEHQGHHYHAADRINKYLKADGDLTDLNKPWA